jgi:flagellar hook-basal body complex protein FliE
MNTAISPLTSALQQMQTLASQAAGTSQSGAVTPEAGAPSAAGAGGSFADVLKSSLGEISNAQTTATNESKAFEVGSPNVSLSDVMVDSQKANIGLQFALQVRNKVVSAYSDIMNITV